MLQTHQRVLGRPLIFTLAVQTNWPYPHKLSLLWDLCPLLHPWPLTPPPRQTQQLLSMEVKMHLYHYIVLAPNQVAELITWGKELNRHEIINSLNYSTWKMQQNKQISQLNTSQVWMTENSRMKYLRSKATVTVRGMGVKQHIWI